MEEPPLPAATSAAASGGGRAAATSSWSSSTNWTVRWGSPQDTICFETSGLILEDGGVDDGVVSVSRGLLLTRPDGWESAPCEINVCFREKHEIHRIYVRSTARVYEIYNASELKDRDDEYLCTVRCGAIAKEAFLPRCDSGEADVSILKDFNTSNEVCGKLIKSESNTSSEEDGWVDVKVPDSPLLGDVNNSFSKKQDRVVGENSQIYHEATAEISDASPCTSLKLRLLSLQSKECIHIEEIYIYADPVESDDLGCPFSMGENTTGNSLLAMLVPSVLQLSKSENSKIQDRTVPYNVPVQKHATDASIKTEEIVPEIARGEMQKRHSTLVEKELASAQPLVDGIITPFYSDKEVRVHVPESLSENGNVAHGHLEKTLEELVSRVGRIESFVSRFEEKMLKPLSCIDTRLQHVEQQLDALSLRTASSKPFQCSKISAPEFQFEECDSDGGTDISDVAKEDATVDSPDVLKEDATVNSPNLVEEDATVGRQKLVKGIPDASPLLPAADEAASVVSSDICPGLFIKAPEFLSKEDEHITGNGISESTVIPSTKAKASLSIDDALSSALYAFLSSASTESPKNDITSVPESQASNDAVENHKFDEVGKISGIIFSETNRVCSVNLGSCPDITYHEGEGQEMFHEKWSPCNFEELAIEEVFCINPHHVRDNTVEIDENKSGETWADDVKDREEVPSEVPKLAGGFKNWIEESSSDLDIDESIMDIHHSTNLLEENSLDLENESLTLRNWLYGHQNDHRFKEGRFIRAMNYNHLPYSDIRDISARCNEDKSKVEILKVLNSSQDGEFMTENSLSNDESSLLDVQFVSHEKLNYTLPLDDLIMDTVDSQIDAYGNNWFDDITVRQQCNSCLSDIAQVGDPLAVDNFLINLEGVVMKNSDFSMKESNDQPLFSSLI